MAEKIAVFPQATRRSKYDVKTWFNGDVWKLTEGVDFNVPVPSFRGSLYNQASKLGVKIETAVVINDNGSTSLVVHKTGKREIPAKPGRPAKPAAKKAAA